MVATLRDRYPPITFEMPAAYWPRVWAALEPATRDPNPSKWVALGKLEITTRDGHGVHVDLYSLSKPPGAFSAGPTSQERVYYRGGNSAALKQVLDEAYEASKKSD